MKLKEIAGITACLALGICGGIYGYTHLTAQGMEDINTLQIQVGDIEFPVARPPVRDTVFGDYLKSQFAQQHHDWKKAGDFLDKVLVQTPSDDLVLKRAMTLAMGSGDPNKSITLAKKVIEIDKNNALALLFLAADSLKKKEYKAAEEYVHAMPTGSVSEFIMPMMEGWVQAGLGNYYGEHLTKNTVHLHHAILMADYLGKKEEIGKMLDLIMASQPETLSDLEHIAQIYAYSGDRKKAENIYRKIIAEQPDNSRAVEKLADMLAGKDVPILDNKIVSPEAGVAITMQNMAQLLYQEYADESARVFSNIALHLDPSLTDAQLLLAAITTRNDRKNEAIAYYRSISPDSEFFLEARRRAADLLEDTNQSEEAIAELNGLFKNHNDIESLVRIGDIYRRQENFEKAVNTYDDAIARLGGKVTKEHWQLLYARGMSLERMGQWDKAEADLKATLAFQPEHPYVLNYLAYAWADKGVNLDQALDMLKKASSLRPSDGYITDSLGWVYFRLERYKEAVPLLEAAVEILPYDPAINDHLGDAYWKTGRKLEARFQWQRARNFSIDNNFIAAIEAKLAQGMDADPNIKQARHDNPAASGNAVMNP